VSRLRVEKVEGRKKGIRSYARIAKIYNGAVVLAFTTLLIRNKVHGNSLNRKINGG
jgi:hypothetical protein